MTLSELPIGASATVRCLTGFGPVRKRLMDMGLTPGVKITVRKVAPLGDPIEINFRGYELSIRKNDAAMIELQPFVDSTKL